MQNNPQVIESVSRAIGQIYTKGRLMNEEMRQLAEAGIPVYEILAEKLGLTQEQLQNLGKQAIPASKAINALIDGMNERFGGVVAASSTTMQGIISNIKDNATMIASGVFEPMYKNIKAVLYEFGQFLFKLREIYAAKGLGGIFEAIFPEELHSTLRQFTANVSILLQSIIRLASAIGTLLRPITESLLRVFNAFAPVLTFVFNALAAIINIVTSNATAMKVLTTAIATAAAMWIIFKVKGLAAAVVAGAITLVSKALSALSTMLTFVVAHPFWSLLILIGGLVVGLSGGFGKLSEAINGMFKSLTKIGGVDPDKLLLPSQEERANDLNKFNEALDDTSDSMDDLADSTGKATKAAKGLLSFDEVFKLNQPDEGTSGGIDVDTDFEIPDVGDLGLGSIDTESLNFSGFADNYVAELIKALKEKIIGAGIGAIIGGILGGVLGGVPGAKLGAAIGALAGWFWDDLATKLGLTDAGKIAVPIATGIGAIIGAIAGGPPGAAIGAAIGGLVSWLVESISRGFETGNWSGVAMPLGIGVGAAIGAVIGGPPGAIIGAAVGALVGWIGKLLMNNWSSITQWFSDTGDAIGQWISGAIDAYNEWATNVENTVNTWCGSTWNSFTTWVSDTTTAIGDWCSNAIDSYNNWATNVENTVNTWCDNTWNSFTTWVSNTVGAIGDWCSNAIDSYNNWATNVEDTVNTWCDNTWDSFSTWVSDVATAISNWCTDADGSYTRWCTDVENKVRTWCDNTWRAFTTWVSNTAKEVGAWCSNVISSYNTWADNVERTINTWCSNTWRAFTNWFSDLRSATSRGLSNIWTKISTWVSDLWSNLWKELSNIGKNISNWWDNLWKGKSADVNVNANVSGGSNYGHATGGVFNREHIARFAEGNKAEAIIPLENASAMQPFVDAVANGLTATLMPLVANISGGQSQLQPLYVGTLVADERSLKELERKMQLIRMQEDKRRG